MKKLIEYILLFTLCAWLINWSVKQLYEVAPALLISGSIVLVVVVIYRILKWKDWR